MLPAHGFLDLGERLRRLKEGEDEMAFPVLGPDAFIRTGRIRSRERRPNEWPDLVQGSNGDLMKMTPSRYDSEALLQELIAQHPDVLHDADSATGEPRKWLLITREAGIPDREGGDPRWSLDHLLIDQDGVPTFVEVKRSTDTRIRREVVGQMLDYAANAVLRSARE